MSSNKRRVPPTSKFLSETRTTGRCAGDRGFDVSSDGYKCRGCNRVFSSLESIKHTGIVK